MTNKTIAQRIATLMTFYSHYSDLVTKVLEAETEEEKEQVRFERDYNARIIREELDALKALGIDLSTFDHIGK